MKLTSKHARKGPHQDGPWSVDGINEKLAELRTTGKSASQIAKMLSHEFRVTLTRNAVISKIYRNGWSHPRAKKPASALPPKRPAKPKVFVEIKPEPYLVRSDLTPAVARKTFLQLEREDCRWPVGDPGTPGFGFCGQEKAAGMSYCRECCVRAYQPPVVRQKARETEFA